MITNAKRIFMNEADSSPGNAAPVAAAAPAEPPADTAAPAPVAGVSLDQVKGLLAESLSGFKNGLFAEFRKAGVLKQDKPADPPTQPTQSAPSAQAGLSTADLDARFELERVIATREGKHGLNEAQSRRLRSALSGVPRESFAAEADSYLADMGLVKAATPPAPAQPTVTAPAKPNISDRGTAAPTDTRDSDGVLNSRPLEMTAHDVDALVLKHGHEKGMQMYQERVLSALRGVRIKPPRG
jgi:hypothetical protein